MNELLSPGVSSGYPLEWPFCKVCGGDFVPRGYLIISKDSFGFHDLGVCATNIYCVETEGVVNHAQESRA